MINIVERLEDMKHTPVCLCMDCLNLTTAISVLKRIDVDKIAVIIANKLVDDEVGAEDIEDLFSVKELSLAIINYLGGTK